MSGGRESSSGPTHDGTILDEFFHEVKEYAIFLIETDGTVASWNDGAERIKGYTRDEILGRHISVFYPDDASNTDPETVLSHAIRRGSYEQKGWRVRKDGSLFWAQVTIRALYDDDETLEGFVKIVRDITETREYQERLERIRGLLERTEELANVGGWELNYDTGEFRVTDGTRHLLDVPDGVDLTVRDVGTFFKEDDRDAITDALQRVRQNGGLFDVELRIVTAKGRKRWVQIRGTSTDDEETVRGAVRDVSDRREREERLMVLNRVLRHNLRNNLNVVTGYANELKTELEGLESKSVVDDDLTHLLEAIDGLVETTGGLDSELVAIDQMVSAMNEFEAESAVQMTDQIIDNAEDLMSTGEKARTFEQAVNKEIETSAIGVHDIVSDLQRSFQQRYPDSEIHVTGERQVVFGNRRSLRLALSELVHNAIIHSNRPSPTVEIATHRISDNRVAVTVKDDGPGIPKNEEEILRKGKETALTHGSGMGLWAVHWAVTQMGGDVSITRRDTNGSTVEIHLPVPREDEE